MNSGEAAGRAQPQRRQGELETAHCWRSGLQRARLKQLHLDQLGRRAAQGQVVAAHIQRQRAAQRSLVDHLYLRAAHQSHIQQALAQRVLAANLGDAGLLADLQLSKRSGHGVSLRLTGKQRVIECN